MSLSAKLSAASPSTTPESQPSNWVLIGRMLALGWRYRLGCVQGVLLQMLRVGFSLGSLGLVGLGIDVLRHEVDPSAAPPRWPLGLTPPADWSPMFLLISVAASILLLSLCHGLLRYASEITAARLVERIVVQLRSDVYAKLQRLSFRFFDANETGSIINRVAGDVQAVRMFVDGVMIQMVVVFLSLAVYLTYMLSIHVSLTIACLATTPLLWVTAVIFSRSVRPEYLVNRTLVDKMVLTLSENVQGVNVVKGFAREPEEIAKFDRASTDVCDQKHKIFWQLSFFQPGMALITNLNLVALLSYGGYLITVGELRLGEGLFVFAGLLQQFANQVDQVTNIANRIQFSLTGAQRVFEVLDAEIEIQSPPDPVSLSEVRGVVRFEHVGFEYKPGQPVLDDIHFQVAAGSCIALVGATGSGKTSLLSLIPRLYDATSGRILIDGIDVREMHLDELRRNIGIVFQESFLFSNTVAANIAFGHPEATREQIEQAAKIAAAHDFIMELPKGYDTVIGEYGSSLSGGQRQRLAIARALLLAPPILILDDATAAIDPGTEHEIMQALESAMQGRTTFIIAHRLSTLRRADLVIVLEHGRIEQMGTHEQLMQQDGHYSRAALLQISGHRTGPMLSLSAEDHE